MSENQDASRIQCLKLIAPTHSPERLAAVRESGLLDSPVDAAFDRLTKLATIALRVPVALISLVDDDRQFFKSSCGLPLEWAAARQTPLSHSFCQHVVDTAEPLLVSNALENDLVRSNLAVPDLGVIAYAGVPLRDDDGYILGSLCAIDVKPRDWTSDDVELLNSLAAQVMMEVRLRAQATALARDLERQRAAHANRQALARLTVHDLRTPLTALLMGMELIPRVGSFNDHQKSAFLICKRNGNAVLSLIDDLLDIGAIEHRGGLALQQDDCRAQQAVTQAVEQVQAIAQQKSIRLTDDLSDCLPMIFADRDKLVRVLVNLLGNAIKFTPEGGQVSVTALEICEEGRTFLKFSVQDTGIGIAAGESIFEEGVRLDRTAATQKSAGLGLTFCKRIVDAHGGRIWFESEPRVGSTFHFTIPVVRS